MSSFAHLNAASYAINFVVTYSVGASDLIDLPNNAELSRKYQTLVTPVGWAFSIWGIIFSAQAIWTAAQFFTTTPSAYRSVTTIGYDYLYICLAQTGWTIAFSNEIIWLSWVMMTLILGFLWKSILALASARIIDQEQSSDDPPNWLFYFLCQFPFEIHAGWITAAWFVNLNLVMVAYKTSATAQFYAAGLSLVSLLAVALWSLFLMQGRPTVALTAAWALMGVAVELHKPDAKIIQSFSTAQIEFARRGATDFACFLASMCLICCFSGS